MYLVLHLPSSISLHYLFDQQLRSNSPCLYEGYVMPMEHILSALDQEQGQVR